MVPTTYTTAIPQRTTFVNLWLRAGVASVKFVLFSALVTFAMSRIVLPPSISASTHYHAMVKEEFKKKREKRNLMQKVTPFLWFDDEAEEAAKFYTSIFKNSKIGRIARYGKEGFEVHHRQLGAVMTVEFEIDGQKFVALNGGPEFKFTEAVSFAVDCKTQAEVDMFWKKVTEGGGESVGGWLKDKYGLSSQITPTHLCEMLAANGLK